VPKDWRKIKFNRGRSEIRPFYTKMTAWNAIHRRTPMVSLIFPSLKDKIKLFEEGSKKKMANSRAQTANGPRMTQSQLKNIIEKEQKERTGKAGGSNHTLLTGGSNSKAYVNNSGRNLLKSGSTMRNTVSAGTKRPFF
jgi:hypothetical protein